MQKLSGFVRSHLGAAVAGVTTAVVLVGGLLILTLVGGGGTSPAAASVASTSTTLAPASPSGSSPGSLPAAKRPATKRPATKRPATKRQGVRGGITAINGNTWTLMSPRGVPVTVEVTPSTAFGTKAAPLTASSFAVGDQVVVAGTRIRATVTATRVAKASAAVGSAPSTSTP